MYVSLFIGMMPRIASANPQMGPTSQILIPASEPATKFVTNLNVVTSPENTDQFPVLKQKLKTMKELLKTGQGAEKLMAMREIGSLYFRLDRVKEIERLRSQVKQLQLSIASDDFLFLPAAKVEKKTSSAMDDKEKSEFNFSGSEIAVSRALALLRRYFASCKKIEDRDVEPLMQLLSLEGQESDADFSKYRDLIGQASKRTKNFKAWAAYHEAHALMRMKRFDRAKSLLSQVVAKKGFPGEIQARYARAWANLQYGVAEANQQYVVNALSYFKDLLKILEDDDMQKEEIQRATRIAATAGWYYSMTKLRSISTSISYVNHVELQAKAPDIARIAAVEHYGTANYAQAREMVRAVQQTYREGHLIYPWLHLMALEFANNEKNYPEIDRWLKETSARFFAKKDYFDKADGRKESLEKFESASAATLTWIIDQVELPEKTSGSLSVSANQTSLNLRTALDKFFPLRPDAQANRTRLAEKYFEAKNFGAALPYYAAVCPKIGPRIPAADCYRKHRLALLEQKKIAGSNPEWLKQYERVLRELAFREIDPKAQLALNFEMAESVAQGRDLVAAKKAVMEFLIKYPESEQSQALVVMYFKNLQDQQQTDELARVIDEILKRQIKVKVELKDYLGETRRLSRLARAEKLRDTAKYAEAFVEYDRYYDEYVTHVSAPNALLEAIRAAEKSGRFNDQVLRSQLFIKNHQNHIEAASVEFSLASALEVAGLYDDAAQYYANVSRTRAADSRAATAALSAAKLWKLERMHDQAQTAYEYFFNTWPKDSFRAQALLDYAESLEMSGKRDRALAVYRQFVGSFPNESSRLLIALAAEIRLETEAGNDSFRSRATDLHRLLTKPGAPILVRANRDLAKAMLALMKVDIDRAKNLHIDATRPTDSLNNGQLTLKALAASVEKIALLKDEELLLNAYFELGRAHEVLGARVRGVALPKSFSPDQFAQATMQFNVVAESLDDGAIKFYKRVVDKATARGFEYAVSTSARQRLLAMNQADNLLYIAEKPVFSRMTVSADRAMPELISMRGEP